MTTARMLKDDPFGVWKAGEEGTVLDNDYPKYDYRIELPPVRAEMNTSFYKKGDMLKRILYFYKDEVEILNGGR